MGETLLLADLDRSKRTEDTVAIISTTSAVELVASDDWFVEGETLVPADEGRLLIVVTVEENRLSVRRRTLDIDVDEG